MPQMLAAGVIVAMFACLLLAVVIISRRRFLDDPKKFDGWLGLPVVASIAHTDDPAPLRSTLAPDDLASKGITSLCTAIDLMTLDTANTTIAITGVADDVGAAFVASNLAAALCKPGQKVLLVDAGLPPGTLHTRFDVEATPGLSDVLANTCEPAQAAHEPMPGLDFIACGSADEAAPTQAGIAAFLAECSTAFDWVILLTPPASEPAPAALIARHCSLALLIARSRRHTQAALDKAIRAMEQMQAKATGLVFNDQTVALSDYVAVD